MLDADNKYRLDRTAFRTMTFEEADNYTRYYKDITWKERLEISLYLTSMGYKFDRNNPPRMNKSVFEIKKING